MEELNICTLFILSNQPTTQPAYRPKSENLPNFDIFQPIWLKLVIESLNGGTQHMHTINSVKPAYHPSSLPPNQLTSPKVKNGYNFVIFQPICLKLGIETQNGKTQHMCLIYIHFVGFVIFWS